jgi:glyoxylase-like metal-dependent hydrolase (beta-lactamase superfamily II)
MTIEPGNNDIVELRKNIYQLSGAKAVGACKAYLVVGRKKNLLIDTGLPSDAEAIGRQLDSLGLTVADIHVIALTHEHIDHIGRSSRRTPWPPTRSDSRTSSCS